MDIARRMADASLREVRFNHPKINTTQHSWVVSPVFPALSRDLTVGYQSVLEGVGHSLRPAMDLEFLQDVLDVVAGGRA